MTTGADSGRAGAVPPAPAWLDELDLHVGPPDASMGTRALDPAAWFVVDDEWDAQRAAARDLLRSVRDEVLVGTDAPGVADAARVLGERIAAWLHAHAHAPDADAAPTEDEPDALAAARRSVADDLCLLLPGGGDDDGDGRWRLAAGCVCFPSYWRPRDRIGEPLDLVHTPVPGYPGALADRVDGFLGRLRPGQGVWRRNWLVHDVPDLHLPGWVDVARPTPVPHGRWLRSERQTLVRLPDVAAVVFTIRTHQVPMTALAQRPDVAGALAAAICGWSEAQRAYKGSAVDQALLDWLDRPSAG